MASKVPQQFARARLTGRVPGLLMHAFRTEDVPIHGVQKAKAPKVKEFDPRQEAEKHAYRLPVGKGEDPTSGELYLPSNLVWAALRNAARSTKIGKSQLATRDECRMQGFFRLHEYFTDQPLRLGTSNYEIDQRPVRNQNTKQTIMSFRPWLTRWEVVCHFANVDGNDLGIVRGLLDTAGKHLGLGSFRLQVGGPFGGFDVSEWLIADEPFATMEN